MENVQKEPYDKNVLNTLIALLPLQSSHAVSLACKFTCLIATFVNQKVFLLANLTGSPQNVYRSRSLVQQANVFEHVYFSNWPTFLPSISSRQYPNPAIAAPGPKKNVLGVIMPRNLSQLVVVLCALFKSQN